MWIVGSCSSFLVVLALFSKITWHSKRQTLTLVLKYQGRKKEVMEMTMKWIIEKGKAKGFFPSQSWIVINFDPLKFLKGPYLSGKRALGPPKGNS